MRERPLAVASFYGIAAIAFVGIAIFNDRTSKLSSSFSVKAHSRLIARAKDPRDNYLKQVLEFGMLAAPEMSQTFSKSILTTNDDDGDQNAYRYQPLIVDFPDWIPPIFQNVWSMLFIVIALSLVLSLVILGQELISKKWERWVSWFEDNANIRHGLMYPQFPVNVMNGLFAVIGPIFILRELGLDVALLGALSFAEHAAQVLTQQLCGTYVDTDGHKPAQRRAVQLLAVAAIMMSAIPLLPSDWITGSRWLIFAWYFLARLVFAWGTNQFDANYNAAVNNSAFLPPQDAARALDLFYFSVMLGGFVGAMLALIVLGAGLESRWALVLLLLLVAVMHFIVDAIQQDQSHVTFPPDPETLAAADRTARHPWISSSRAAPGAAAPPATSKTWAFLKRLPALKAWVYDVWLDPDSRSKLLHFIVIMLLFSSLQVTYTFLLPLGGLSLGLKDEDVAFLVAVPSVVGVFLFWLGSTFDHIGYVTKAMLGAGGFMAAYAVAALWPSLPGLFLGAYLFALASCYTCDLILLLRICYLHSVSLHRGRKNEFSNAQEYASHLIAFNAPLAALAVDLGSVPMAFAVWAAVALAALAWVSLVARKSIEEVTRLDRLSEGEAEDGVEKEALQLFDQIDTNKDGVLSSQEILRFLSSNDVRVVPPPPTPAPATPGAAPPTPPPLARALSYGAVPGAPPAAALARDLLRLADRDGDGSVGRREWVRAFAAVRELVRDAEGDGEEEEEEGGGGPPAEAV